MNFNKGLLVAVFAAAAAATFIFTTQHKNEEASKLEKKKRKKKKALNLTMKMQIQNLVYTQKMIEAVIGAVREYILLKKSKAQVKGIANSDSSTNLLTSSSSSSTMIANAMNPLQAQSTVQNTPSETSYEARKLKPWERNIQTQSSSFTGNFDYASYKQISPTTDFLASGVQYQDQQQPQIQTQIPVAVPSHV